jgi:hypothetical protein
MIKVEQNTLSGVISARCPHPDCNKPMVITTIARYYCIWCSKEIPNHRLLVTHPEERIRYHFTGKVFNVKVPSKNYGS